MHKKLGGDKAGTAEPSQPKGYSIRYNTRLHNKTGQGGEVGGAAIAWGLAAHPSVGGEQLFSFPPFVFLGFILLC